MAKQDPQVETVTMSDGRIVDFPGKRRLQKETLFTADGKVQVRLDFRNGDTRLFTIPEALLLRFAAHGAEQKLGDEIAGLKGADGGEADIEDCVLAIDELIDRLYNGDWTVRREANGMAGTSILLRALVELSGKPISEIKTFLSGDASANPPIPAKTQAEKLALRNSPRIKPIVDRLEAERAAGKREKVDTGALLNKLGVPPVEGEVVATA